MIVPQQPPRPGKRLIGALAGLAAIGLALAGCAAPSAGGGGNASSADAGDCGVIPQIAPNDPNKIVPTLPESVQADFNGFPSPVLTSAFVTTPAKPGPWKIGLLFGANLNDFTAGSIAQLEKDFAAAKAAGLVEGNDFLRAWAADAASQSPDLQVSQYQDLVRQGADAIITVPLSGEAMKPVVDEAGKQGVVTVAIGGDIPSQYAINIYGNPFQTMAEVMSPTLKSIGGKGNALIVRGLDFLPLDQAQYAAVNTMLKTCPNVKVAGTVQGGFTQAGAKSEVLSFLTANAAPINAVFQLNVMAPGIISGFEQAGRDVPSVTMNNAQYGDIAYLAAHVADGYKAWGTANSGADQTEAALRAALRTLSGQGPKTTQFVYVPQLITPENVADFVVPGTDLSSPGEINGKGDQPVLPDDQMNAFFTTPKPVLP